MAWNKFWDNMWYNDATGQYSDVDPAIAEQQMADAKLSGWWNNSEVYKGDANGVGSMTSATNPTTGKAESLVSVVKIGPDGMAGANQIIPYSEYQKLAASDPSWKASMLDEPNKPMADDNGLWGQIMDGIQATALPTLAMAAPALLGAGGMFGAADAVTGTGMMGGQAGADLFAGMDLVGTAAADTVGLGGSTVNVFTGTGIEQAVTYGLPDVGQPIENTLHSPEMNQGFGPDLNPMPGAQEAANYGSSLPATVSTPSIDYSSLDANPTGGPSSTPYTSPNPVVQPPVIPPTLGQVATGAGLANTVAYSGGTVSDLAQFGTGVSADGNSDLNTGGGVDIGGSGAGGDWNWEDWYKLYQSDPGQALQKLMGSSLGNDIKNGLGSLFAYNQNKDYQDQLIGVMNRAIDVSDPFAAQRPFYQNELKNMYTDQNYWDNSPILKSMKDNAMRETNASMASQGYNMSGNQIEGLGQTLQRTQAQYALPLINQTGGFAGAGFGPGTAGTTAAAVGTQAANAGNAGNMALGNMFNSAWNGISNPSGNNTTRAGGYVDANGVWRPA